MKFFKKVLIAGLVAISVFGAFGTFGAAFAAEEEKVIYVSDKGRDSAAGTSASAPKKTLSAAYTALGKKGGTVVICGDLTLGNSAGIVLPSVSGAVKITSVNGAEDFSASAKLIVKNHLYISGETVFENITLQAPAALRILCCGNDVTFGDGIKVRLSSSGSYPYIYGGTYAGKSGMNVDGCSFKDYTVTVNSGTWTCVRGGNFRDDGAQPLGFIGDVRIIINGGTFTGTGHYYTDMAVTSITSFCGLEGDAYMEINGGTFASSVFALGRPGSNSTRKLSSFTGDVTLKITGGRFTGTQQIAAVQELMAEELDGDFTLEITGGDFTAKLTKIQADGVNGARRAFVSTDKLAEKLTDFAELIYVSENGDDNANGGPESPKKTLKAALEGVKGDFGAIIVINDTASLANTDVSGEIKGGVLITSNGGAKLVIEGENKIYAALTLDNLSIEATSASLVACGNSITACENVSVVGELSLDCGEGENSRTLTVYGGTYKELRGGSAENGHTAVVIYGGSAEKIYGSSGKRTQGDASVVVLGGTVNCAVAAGEGCKGHGGVAVYGGTVSEIKSTEGGRISGDFGYALNAANAGAVVVCDAVVGKKLAHIEGAPCPEGFEEAGYAVFFTDGGEGDGRTPKDASGKLYRGMMDAKELGEGNFSVVFIGEYTCADSVSLPDMNGAYDIGGYYCAVNFANAFGSKLNLGGVLTMGGDTVISNLHITAYTDSAYIAANCKKLVVEKDVECSVFFARAITNYPSICGGTATESGGTGGNKSTDVTVNGGSWHYVYGGNIILSKDDAARRSVKGDISLVINGGEFFGGVAANGMNNLTGNAYLTVNGGVFKCSVYGMARASDAVGQENRIKGDITVTLNRGEFRGDILAAQREEDISLEGKYTLTLGGGEYERVGAIKGTEKLGSKASCELNVAENIDISAKIEGELTLENPIASFADPSVYYYGGWYYYTYSKDYAGKPALWLTRAPNIADLGKTEPTMVWSAANSGSNMKSLWAPQIYFLDGKWYIYATCSVEGTSEASRRFPYVWVGKGELPLDEYELHGTVDNYDEEVYSFLSPRIIEHGGVRYLVCGGFYRAEDKVAGQRHYQRLFIGELASPTAFKTGMTVISQPSESWEGTGKVKVQEGPFPIYAPGGTLYIAYAAGETSGNEYCTGLLKFIGGENDSLADPTKWQKLKTTLQFMDYDNKVYSPGAMVFVTEPDGTGLWGIFHAKFYPNVSYNHRVLYAMPVTFEGELPVMSAPELPETTYGMQKNSMPIIDRIFGFEKINTVAPAADPFPETTADPADTDPVGSAPDTDEVGDGTEAPKPQAKLVPVIIGAAVAVIGAIAAAVIVLKKKK